MKNDKSSGNEPKPRRNNDNGNNVSEKKPFDKKKYRLQKYSNKYKVAQWEERRKKAVLRGFYKDLHKDERGILIKPLHLKTAEAEPGNSSNPMKKKSAFLAARKEYQKRKAEKQKKKDELLKSKAEREEALKNYKEKKMEAYKKLSRKTRKGQPVMKDRLELLLEKIKESTF